MGQVYVPQVNWGLMLCTIAMVVGFRSSSALAAAYGLSVNIDMLITATLLYVVATERWRWSIPLMMAVTLAFLLIDVAFLGSNLAKFFHGGWVSVVIGAVIFTLMTTWKTGRRLVAERLTARATPPALAHNLRYNKVLHEHVVVLTVRTTPVPHVSPDNRLEVQALGHGIFNVRVHYGFMEDPNVPEALEAARARGIEMDPGDVTYFLGRETIIPTQRRGMALWRERLFVVMARNALRATAFFRLPAERVVELGVQVEV
jgi:KUP system potassium uptake protein